MNGYVHGASPGSTSGRRQTRNQESTRLLSVIVTSAGVHLKQFCATDLSLQGFIYLKSRVGHDFATEHNRLSLFRTQPRGLFSFGKPSLTAPDHHFLLFAVCVRTQNLPCSVMAMTENHVSELPKGSDCALSLTCTQIVPGTQQVLNKLNSRCRIEVISSVIQYAVYILFGFLS